MSDLQGLKIPHLWRRSHFCRAVCFCQNSRYRRLQPCDLAAAGCVVPPDLWQRRRRGGGTLSIAHFVNCRHAADKLYRPDRRSRWRNRRFSQRSRQECRGMRPETLRLRVSALDVGQRKEKHRLARLRQLGDCRSCLYALALFPQNSSFL